MCVGNMGIAVGTVQAARLEAEVWAAEYQPSWTYQDGQGASQGPFQLAELKAMIAQYATTCA